MQNTHIASLYNYLKSIRQSYLSTSTPPRRSYLSRSNSSSSIQSRNQERKFFTDQQRDEIDAETKQLLRELNAAIRNLADAEKLRQDTEATLNKRKYGRMGFGVLGNWAAGGDVHTKTMEEMEDARANGVKVHRESVLWYLRSKLEE